MWARLAAWCHSNHAVTSATSVRPIRALKWLAVVWIVVFWRLGYLSLLDPDEAHYAQLTREMLRARSWLVPLLDGAPIIDKPVLFHWLQAASVALFGDTEFSVRLPTACAAVGAIAATQWTGKRLFDERVGRWGAALFATLPATFALSAIALFDMMFTLFVFACVAGLLACASSRGDRRIETAAFVCLALAVMTKGPVALVLVGLWVLAMALVDRRARSGFADVRWGSGLLLVAVIAAPWFVWMYLQFGDQFVEGYLRNGNLFYFTQPARFSRRPVEHTYYARVFIGAFFPCSAIVVARVWQNVRSARDGARIAVEELGLWTWIVVVIAFFSAARFKLDHYLFPAAPAIAVISARTWLSRRASDDKPLSAILVALSIALGAIGIVLAAVMHRLDLELDARAMLLPLALVGTGSVLLADIIRRGGRAPATPATIVTGLLAVYAVVVVVGLPVLENTRPMAHIARRIERRSPPGTPVALYGLDRWRSSLRYYVKRPIAILDTPDAVRDFMARNPDGRIVMRRTDFEAFRTAGVPVETVYERRGVVGTTGRGLRRQVWGRVVIVMSPGAAARSLADLDTR